ncbi:MAG TPA: FAD-dependent oxidoreductase [Spirochaetota bacterium]|nr:FAD-dependent oxidoreductase [Spirochaetota bacterium]HPC39901.1 FAD-dependent oxidoreductase [Spirochaetota bacterium]HQF08923.1 FAD-dependent oxidoreductase [Spirochaetota bacterium]HQH97849.1 FAD-dependent oxidoreductase [Spirochaetota bacterium]HQJ71519.1 FAD-dependent oxidoreductase [Spirochaetota bacterium]
MFDNLFSPITINKTVVKNRIAYPSLGLLYSYDGNVNDRYVNFFAERARGGAGIVTVGPVGFDEVGSGKVILVLDSDDKIPDYARLTSAIKKEGALSWIQLFHAGAYSYSKFMGGPDPIAPSPIYSKYSKLVPREMTLDDIREAQEGFVKAAVRAKEAGFDGVEIIASAGYLITQFLSPLKNQRTDRYGGSFENRVRFPREILEMMRAALGPDYPISIRMAGNDFVAGSNTSSETPAFAKVYEKAGVDLISVTGGWHEAPVPQLPMDAPRSVYSYLALNVKREVSVPVSASNRITDPFSAEQLIKDGYCDIVNLARILIADPYWPKKAEEGLFDEIRPCVACNQGCTDSIFSGKAVYCIANARAGYEGERTIVKAKAQKKIMVIGSGPAGLEAAVRSAEAGHAVELYEKADRIGGQLWIAGAPPHKHEIWELIAYYDAMLDKYDIDVNLETEATIDLIRERKPDHVFVAEGAEPVKPRIDGIDDPKVVSAWEVLANDPMLGTNIAIIGGGAVGLETAEFLAAKGTLPAEAMHFLFLYEAETVERLRELCTRGTKKVTVFEMLPKAAAEVGRSTRWVLMGSVKRYGIEVITGAKVNSLKGGAVVYEHGGKTESRQFDAVVNAVGSRSVRTIADAIEKSGIPFTVIGDSVKPARIDKAIHDAFLAVMNLK